MKLNIFFFIIYLIKLVIMTTVLAWFTHLHWNKANNKKDSTDAYTILREL